MNDLDTNTGLYVLLIEMSSRARIRVGALGEFDFEAGWYFYTGSARRNLAQRVARHLSMGKRIRWHVDYLTSHPASGVVDTLLLRGTTRTECEVNQAIGRGLAGSVPVPGFGSSDCLSGCPAHLWYSVSPARLTDLDLSGGKRAGLGGRPMDTSR